jgi:hypothetical protein
MCNYCHLGVSKLCLWEYMPIRAISLLKSPSIMMLLWGLLWMWLNIVVWIMGIRLMSSMCMGM